MGESIEHLRGSGAAVCANCGQSLELTDKYCRECGLPTLRQAETQRAVPVVPPDAPEIQRALNAAPDIQPFTRSTTDELLSDEDLTTGGVLRVTSPTYATRMAASTGLMVAAILALVIVGVLLLVIAFRQ